jgi:hypothetical protein
MWIGYPISLLIILAIDSFKFKTKFSFGIIAVSSFAVFIFYYFIVHLPVAALIYYSSDSNNCDTYNCEIVWMGTSHKDRSLTYTFRQQNFKFYNYQP